MNLVLEEEEKDVLHIVSLRIWFWKKKKKGEKKEDYLAAERCLTHKLPLNLVLEEEKETEKEKKERLFL